MRRHESIFDPRLRVDVLSETPQPQTLVWRAMHQCYAEGPAADDEPPTETEAGSIAVRRLLAGERGHYGPLEHPAIAFNVIGFPHSVLQQARTHRIGVSFDVQSFRYTGTRIVAAAKGEIDLEDVVYLRPVGEYRDRSGHRYYYSDTSRQLDLELAQQAIARYAERVADGTAEEHARCLLPFDVRQHFVVSFNLRSVLHFLDLRCKKDAQREIQELGWMLWHHVEEWAPEIAGWYYDNRLGKARLAP